MICSKFIPDWRSRRRQRATPGLDARDQGIRTVDPPEPLPVETAESGERQAPAQQRTPPLANQDQHRAEEDGDLKHEGEGKPATISPMFRHRLGTQVLGKLRG